VIIGLIRSFATENSDKLKYIIINVFVFFLRFIRSFIFMKFLNFEELGVITIISTVISLFGMLQFGLLNGGYRIFSLQKSTEEESAVNNLIHTFFLLLSVLLVVVAAGLHLFKVDLGAGFIYILLAIAFGVISIINNWIGNILSAHMNFRGLNFLEVVSTLISLLFLLTMPFFAFYGALLSTFSAPLIYVIIAYMKYPVLMPRKLQLNIKLFRWILTFGFIPFLAGIFVQMNSQIERWSIVSYLNTEALGRFYLPTFYATLFLMVPLAVNKLFFPPIILKFTQEDFKGVKRILNNYLLFILIYSVITITVTILLIKPVVGRFLPQHLFAIEYIWYLIPGLIAMLLLQPLEILYNASVKLTPVFWTYFASVGFMLLLVILSARYFEFTLSGMAMIKSIVLIFILTILFIYYAINRKAIWQVNVKKENYK
jgi:O-antigen/teichoic acid export membrane protein